MSKFSNPLGGGVARGGFGVKTPTVLEKLFNLLGFFEKKIRKPPLNFVRSIQKKFKSFPSKNFWLRPYLKELIGMEPPTSNFDIERSIHIFAISKMRLIFFSHWILKKSDLKNKCALNRPHQTTHPHHLIHSTAKRSK